MADDPGATSVLRHEQMAQSQRYDQSTDMLYEANVRQSELDRNYRDRMYYLMQRIAKDSNNDYRRLDELDRAHECSRECITDCNI
jgi:hypothetical protein